ncbi:glycoside hydrolase [Microstroma glucosiphilum]|uniref:Glycoside hydrolase n=1 Tax=Pseudomicrostroma glucosiphilum TaxID=1684307 RepID=A0A316U8E7_9BASI|nr:glycoside hydrolase [Pseudomicrostroma glucosiphilum]PWN19255.1 glycoside hydrolase [Pseudomicrostroma glucosiphilum]
MSGSQRYHPDSRRPGYRAPAYDEKYGSGVNTPSEYEPMHKAAAQRAPHLYAQPLRTPIRQQRSRPWYKRPKPVFWTFILLAVLGLGVGLGVHFGLRSRGSDNGDLDFPSMNLASDQAGMETVGSFVTGSGTSYGSGKLSTVFSWSSGGFDLGATGAGTDGVDLLIDTTAVQQPMDGFGASFTDSSCSLLHTLKLKNETHYNQTMDYFTSARTGMSVFRVPIAASDYSAQGEYSYADTNATKAAINAGNTTSLPSPLADFNVDKAEAYVFPVLRDALARRPDAKIWLSPWSPPAWMKTTNSFNGGQLIYGSEELYAQYLFLTVQAYTAQGIRPYGLTMQNEPTDGTTSYPTNWMSPASSALVARALRTSLDEHGFDDVKLFANDDNYIDWASAAEAVQADPTAWSGVAWHGYNGNYTSIGDFNTSIANVTTPMEQHLTEITTTDNSRDQWYSARFWLTNFYFGPINMGVRSVITWNIALDKNDSPHISSAPCEDCLGTFTIDSPSANLNPPVQASNAQFITTYHFSSAVANLTNFGGGPAYRVSAAPTASASNSLRGCIDSVSAFAAPWNGTSLSGSNMKRVGLVAVNDCSSGVKVRLGIDDRQGTFSFSPGITTLIFNV